MIFSNSPFLSVKWRFTLLIILLCVWVICIINVCYTHFENERPEGWLNGQNSYNNYCFWNDSIYVNQNGSYELQLCYKTVFLPVPTPTIEESKIRINGSSRRLTLEELASIPDAEWLTHFDRSVYQLYPQSIPLRDTLQSLLNGKPIPQVSSYLTAEISCNPPMALSWCE